MGSTRAAQGTGRRRRFPTVGILGWLLTLATVVLLQRERLLLVVHTLQGKGRSTAGGGWLAVALAVAVPFLVGITVELLSRLLGHALGIARYVRSLHAYAARYLDQHATLQRYGLAPGVIRLSAAGEPMSGGSQPFPRLAELDARVLLLGEPGAGKSVALHALAYELTRRRWLLSCLLGRRPLPVVVPLPAYAEAAAGRPRRQFLTTQIARFGTIGFAKRISQVIGSDRFLLLCDELDAVPETERTAICEELASLRTSGRPPARTIITCDFHTYLHAPQTFAPLRGFARMILADIPTGSALAAARRARGTAPRDRQHALAPETHRLETALGSPALLAALLTLLEAGTALPYGRGPLLSAFLARQCALAATRAPGVEGERLQTLLAAMAASLREMERRALPLDGAPNPGAAILAWLAAHPPVEVTEHRSVTFTPPSTEEIEASCRSAIEAGLLVVRGDGRALEFAHRLVETGFAAHWLRLGDDGMGRLQPGLLRPRWTLPVVLWSATGKNPADVAKRLLRLAETPDGTAVRAGLTSSAAVYPAALALAVACAVESFADALARPAETAREAQRMRDLAQQHLRDMLDQALVYMGNEDRRARVTRSVQQVEEVAGAEMAASIAYLIHQTELNRLLRAQLVGVLGMMASPPALAVLVELLGEMDPVIRQATEQAFRQAGGAALAPLQTALTAESETVRARAGEVLAGLGEIAVDNALAGLGSASPAERTASAHTLGLLRATQAVEPLISRLDDGESAVRVAAARALGAIDTSEAGEALLRAARSPDAALRAAVARGLGTRRHAQGMHALIELLGDPDAEVRAAAAEALGKLGDERAVAALRERRDDPDPWAQHAAVAALRRLGRH